MFLIYHKWSFHRLRWWFCIELPIFSWTLCISLNTHQLLKAIIAKYSWYTLEDCFYKCSKLWKPPVTFYMVFINKSPLGSNPPPPYQQYFPCQFSWNTITITIKYINNTVMILAGAENIWNRLGVEGAALRPPRRVQGQSPCWGYGGEAPIRWR